MPLNGCIKSITLECMSFCYGLLHDSDKAKDIAQECFVAFWEYRTRIDAPKAISTYLFCIMKNLCMKQIRRDAILDNFLK